MMALLWLASSSVAAAWTSALSTEAWSVVNDSVMGGVSTSQVIAGEQGALVFTGQLSLDNNGGFTSARTQVQDSDWTGAGGLRMQVKGDGRDYIATVRIRDRSMRRIYYRAPFSTDEGTPIVIDLAFSDFDAYAFGRRIPQAPPLRSQLNRIGSVGVMLADKKPGTFSLEISSLQTIASDPNSTQPSPAAEPLKARQIFAEAIKQGVPLFNAGGAQKCADVYAKAIERVTLLGDTEVSTASRAVLIDALKRGRKEADPVARAWLYRHTMDWLLAQASK